MKNYNFNHFTGNLDITSVPTSIEVAEKIAAVFSCAETVQVGDLVRADNTTSDTVVTVDSNVYNDIVFGMVINKTTTTSCEVLVSGKVEGSPLSGLSFGKVIWVGTSGEVTTTKPASGHIQKLGIAIKADAIFLLPSTEKVILT